MNAWLGPLKRWRPQVIFPGAVFALFLAQVAVYRAMTNVRPVKDDPVFMAVAFAEYVVVIGLMFLITLEVRKKSSRQK